MRIALVTRRFPPLIGGAEKVLSYLATALAATGNEVTVLTSRLDDSPARESVRDVRIVRLATSRHWFIGTWLYMRNLQHWFAHNKIDISYVSMMKHDAYIVVEMGRRQSFPVVLRPEGAGATGDVAWQAWGWGGRAIAQRAKQADVFVAISTAVHEELIAAGYDVRRIADLPNGVPVPELSWEPRPDWSQSPRAVFVGRLAPEKGLHALVDAWPIVRRTFSEARLTLIGEGPERSGLSARIAELGLGGSIDLPGSITDPSTILRESDLFVLPSREEGMSIALLEAMALGMPLVASAIPGNQKLINDGRHGRLAPPDDPEGLAQAIIDSWRNFTAAVGQGREARQRVLSHYSINTMAHAHLDLFRRLTTGGIGNDNDRPDLTV